jgi:hypothetical protein
VPAGRRRWHGDPLPGGAGRAREPATNKKKARRNLDAPSNKMFGNCLLALHCSQNTLGTSGHLAARHGVAAHQQPSYSHDINRACRTLASFARSQALLTSETEIQPIRPGLPRIEHRIQLAQRGMLVAGKPLDPRSSHQAERPGRQVGKHHTWRALIHAGVLVRTARLSEVPDDSPGS